MQKIKDYRPYLMYTVIGVLLFVSMTMFEYCIPPNESIELIKFLGVLMALSLPLAIYHNIWMDLIFPK